MSMSSTRKQRWTKGSTRMVGSPFDLTKPRGTVGLSAEARFNSAVVDGRFDKRALETLVREHVERYPYGIDPSHPRKINGFAHK